jgi:hypothetical protein
MARPGTTISRSETRPTRSARTSTGPWFIAGITGTPDTELALNPGGPRKAVKNLTEYATRFGSRTAHGANPEMYDAAEFYFKHGGAELFVSRTADALDPALTAALALFTKDLGPGQVSAPARTTAAQKLLLANHARDNNRLAILSTTNTAVVATLTAEATIAGITADAERFTALFGPWVTVPGVTSGTTRTISPESIVAGLMARNDSLGISPNQPSAGHQFGESDYAINVTQNFSDVDRATLNVNGVNLLRLVYDGVRVYGYRTLADPTTDASWVNLGNARLFMGIQAKGDEIAERFVFRELDGQRKTISEYGGALTGMLLPYWQVGSLYGATPEEAFRVDVGPNINTEATIADRQLRANLILRASEFAEEVVLELVKARTTEVV